ncbi:hypothetical protein IAD21_00551 [Abditibacteriota bacterium]|nr:hypothetical protein IAD21_00551 [Abditibacteriota bacterium]
MNTLAEKQGAFNASNDTGTEAKQLFSLTSGTRYGVSVHMVTTRDRDFYMAVFEGALEYDSDPSYKATRGVYFVEFVADDEECASVLRVARGGNA